mgnify:CR=1
MSYKISAINPSYPNACVNEVVSGVSSLTQSTLDSNPIASKFGAELNVSCASRGFATKGAALSPQTMHFGPATVQWNGQVWTK